MNCDFVVERLSAYADGELPAAEHETVRLHVAGCAACRDEYGALRETSSALRSHFAASAAEDAGRTPEVPPALAPDAVASAGRRSLIAGRILRFAPAAAAAALTVFIALRGSSTGAPRIVETVSAATIRTAVDDALHATRWASVTWTPPPALLPMIRLVFPAAEPVGTMLVGPNGYFYGEVGGIPSFGPLAGRFGLPAHGGGKIRGGSDGRSGWLFTDGSREVMVRDVPKDDARAAAGFGDDGPAGVLLFWDRMRDILESVRDDAVDGRLDWKELPKRTVGGETLNAVEIKFRGIAGRSGFPTLRKATILFADDNSIREIDCNLAVLRIARLEAPPESSTFDWRTYAPADAKVVEKS